MKPFPTFSLLLAGVFVQAACRPADPHIHGPEGHSHGSDESQSADNEKDQGILKLSQAARKNLGISFVRLDERRVSSTLRVPGAFELQPLAQHEYRMALPGRIELLVDQYERVEPGAVLFRFQSPKWPELLHEILIGEQEIASSSAEIEVAEAMIGETRAKLSINRDRIEALASAEFKRADLQSELQTLEASLPRLEAQLRAARSKLDNAHKTRDHAVHVAASAAEISEADLVREVEKEGKKLPAYRTLDWIEVHAKTAGIVDHLDVTDGTYIDASVAVLSVVDPELVRFRALAMQSDLGTLTGMDRGELVPPRGRGRSIGSAVGARVTLGLEAHPAERTLELLAVPDESAPWIRPGVAAFLELVTDESQPEELAVPTQSIVQDGVRHVVYLRHGTRRGEVRPVEVQMGVSDGRWTVVSSEEEAFVSGREVVYEGAYELKLASDSGGISGSAKAPTHVHADGTTH